MVTASIPQSRTVNSRCFVAHCPWLSTVPIHYSDRNILHALSSQRHSKMLPVHLSTAIPLEQKLAAFEKAPFSLLFLRRHFLFKLVQTLIAISTRRFPHFILPFCFKQFLCPELSDVKGFASVFAWKSYRVGFCSVVQHKLCMLKIPGQWQRTCSAYRKSEVY